VTEKQITLVAAMDRKRGIGRGGQIPWHLPAELQHFKAVTMGGSMVMGRKTWETIGRPLPGRESLVVSRQPGYRAGECAVYGDVWQAVNAAASTEVMIIGGGEIYRLTLPRARRMVLTLVDTEVVADTWFPRWDTSAWQQVSERAHPADDRNPLAFRITEWLRADAPG